MPPGFADLLARNLHDLGYLRPELLVAAGFVAVMCYDLFAPPDRRKYAADLCVLFVLLAFLDCLGQLVPGWATGPGLPWSHAQDAGRRPFSGMVARDAFAAYFDLILLAGTAVTLLVARYARQLQGRHLGEFCLLLMAACLGGMFFGAATNLLMLYLGLEMLSIVSYALAGYLKHDRLSAEAGIKYAIYGALASGLMIFGMSYLYGLTGTLELRAVAGRVHELLAAGGAGAASRGAVVTVLALVGCGFLYKIAAVPFHFWSPDVYEGAPTTATAFFSVVPKAAGFAALTRVLVAFFPLDGGGEPATLWAERAVAVVAVLTMTLGNLAALGQTNAKRMLAYSSIAHAGYMLAALAALDDSRGPAVLLFYVLAYLFMNLGAFLTLVGLENLTGSCELRDLRGLVRREPVLAVLLVVFLFSLVGMPPLAGFTAKYLIMLKLADRQMWLLVFAIGINSVVSLFYYMRLAKAVVMDEPERELAPVTGAATAEYRILASSAAVMLVVLFTSFEPVLRLCRYAVETLP